MTKNCVNRAAYLIIRWIDEDKQDKTNKIQRIINSGGGYDKQCKTNKITMRGGGGYDSDNARLTR